ncbi:MAG: response regulator [Desulfobacterales bacterium]|jgi:signal transduction histidine kinase|nr:response regulator [Desulfobacterales bacterium]
MEKTILLVDDEKDIREVLRLPLTDLGYEVIEAENGADAFHLFARLQPPMILTDIKMPGMDGLELLQKVKRANPEVEVIMITGHGDMELAVKSLKYDATDFITKPINVDVLEIAVQRAAERILTREKLREYTLNLERLVAEKSELQSHLSSLGLMLGSISHALKGLLTGLDAGVYLVDGGLAKGDTRQLREGWEIVKQRFDRIRKVVLDILFYSKKREVKPERMNAAALAEEVVSAVAGKLTEAGIAFVKDLDPGSGELEVDPTYVQAALLNILENAADACQAGETKRTPKVAFSLRRRKDRLEFDILDNGVGMDAGTQDKLFTPFFSSKGDKGTGLGLFIANKIVEQHGGEISVSSAPGRGSLFRVSLPAVSRAAAPENGGGIPGAEHPRLVKTPAAEKVLT